MTLFQVLLRERERCVDEPCGIFETQEDAERFILCRFEAADNFSIVEFEPEGGCFE